MSVEAYVGLGSNLEQPRDQVRRALSELADLALLEPRASPLYGSKAIGPGRQPDYVNAVAGLRVDLSAHALLDALQRLESAHRRRREVVWGARTLDLDLLLYGEEVIDDERLQVPHPRLAERAFVLYPLRDLAPDLRVPGRGSVRELAAACEPGGIWLLGDD